MVDDITAPSEAEIYTTRAEWTLHPLIIIESPASPDPPTPADGDTDLTSTMAATLQGDDDPEFVGYGAYEVTTSPVTSAMDSLPELRVTPAVSTLPKASASMSGPRSPTPPTASWSWLLSDDGDDNNYRGVVDDCSDAVIHQVRRAMNTCYRARVANEVRACFGVLMQDAMEPAFLDDIANVVDKPNIKNGRRKVHDLPEYIGEQRKTHRYVRVIPCQINQWFASHPSDFDEIWHTCR